MRACGPRFAVLGTCQVSGVAAALRAAVPGASADEYHLGASALTPPQILDRLRNYDHILVQGDGHFHFEPLRPNSVLSAFPNALQFPVVVFSGFQPDCIYLFRDGQMLSGVLGDVHSAVGAYGYALGLSEARTAKLYNTLVFSALGYFESYDVSRSVMSESWRVLGFDVDGHIEAWQARVGAFMYTVNHPRVCVLVDIARQCMDKLAVPYSPAALETDIVDSLANSVHWPVYTDLARKLGIPPQPIFRWSVGSGDRDVSLADYLSAAFQSYESHGRERIRGFCDQRALDTLDGLIR